MDIRIKMLITCPRCGKEFKYRVSVPQKGFNTLEYRLKCSCGCEVQLKMRLDANTEVKTEG
jgi:lysyl-tRNA synthetase class I